MQIQIIYCLSIVLTFYLSLAATVRPPTEITILKIQLKFDLILQNMSFKDINHSHQYPWACLISDMAMQTFHFLYKYLTINTVRTLILRQLLASRVTLLMVTNIKYTQTLERVKGAKGIKCQTKEHLEILLSTTKCILHSVLIVSVYVRH